MSTIQQDPAAVFTNRRSAATTTRWLETRSEIGPVTLLHPSGDQTFFESWATSFSAITRRLVLPEPGTIDPQVQQLACDCGATVAAPLHLPVEPMRHAAELLCPKTASSFPSFRSLQRHGFHHFDLWSLAGMRRLNISFLLDDFIDRHRGQRAFVIGNGPSLNQTDVRRLQNEITFGSNQCYLGFERWGFHFTYWACSDRIQIEDYAPEYERNLPADIVKFVPFEYLPFFHASNLCPYQQSYQVLDEPLIASDASCIHMGNTITYSMIQMAILMGCDPIILIGTDHNYNLADLPAEEREKDRLPSERRRSSLISRPLHLARRLLKRSADQGTAAGTSLWTERNKQAATHFDPRYTKNRHFAMPRPRLAENAFNAAARWARANQRTILNATPGTGLRSFPLVNYDDLF